jgi:rod shape-determining protein MreD
LSLQLFECSRLSAPAASETARTPGKVAGRTGFSASRRSRSHGPGDAPSMASSKPSPDPCPMVVSLLFLSGIILLLLQTTLLHFLPEWFGRPNLLFLLIVFIGTSLDIYKGVVLALLFGLIMDIFSGVFLGLHPVIYLILFFVLQAVSRRLAVNDSVHQIPLVALSYLFAASSIFVFTSILTPESRLYWAWGNEILQILILSVICIPFFNFFQWLTTVLHSKNANNHFRRQKTGNRFRMQ